MDIAWFPAKHMDANKKMRVIYNRPQLKSRSLSTLAPNDAVWRTGANEAPEITFYQDVVFGGKSVKAGYLCVVYYSRRKQLDYYFKQQSQPMGLLFL
jgi:hypothetical protein